MNPIARYTQWLHTMWPAGTVEKLPEVREDGTTAVPGVRTQRNPSATAGKQR